MHEPIVESLDIQLDTWRVSMYLAVQIQTGFFCTGLTVRIFKGRLVSYANFCLEKLKQRTDWFILNANGIYAKLYIQSTINIDLILWYTQLIVCAVKW